MDSTTKNRLRDIDPDSCTPFFPSPQSTNYYTLDNLPEEFNSNLTNNLSILHINARSLLPKLNELNCLISNITNLQIISICETWLNDDSSRLAGLNGFNFVSNNRNKKSGGGSGIFLNKDVQYVVRQDLCPQNEVFDWIAVEIHNLSGLSKGLILYSIYRPPNTDINIFIKLLDSSLSKIINQQKFSIYLSGDFNVDLLKDDFYKTKHIFQNFLQSFSFMPLINSPTRITEFSSTLIDNIFSNSFSNHSSGIIYADLSDHLPIFTVCNNNNIEKLHKTCFNRVMSHKGLNDLNNYLANTNWNSLPSDVCLDTYVDNFIIYYENALNKFCPLKKVRPYKIKNPWFTKGILKSF